MALEAAFKDLASQLRKLRDLLQGVSLTTGEDRSERDAVVLVDKLNDSVVELSGCLENALVAAEHAENAVANTSDLTRARRHLAASQEDFQALAEGFFSDLLSYDRIAELLQFGREHGRQWMGWANTVRRGLEACRPQLQTAAHAYFRCWQEIAERVGMNSVCVQSTAIGQQITASLPAAKEVEAGLT